MSRTNRRTSTYVVGVDAGGGGWVAASLHLDGSAVQSSFHVSVADVVAAYPDAARWAIDIPLGLVATGYRRAEVAAKKLLGARSATLFLTPPAAALDELEHARAIVVARELEGPAPSAQLWGMRHRMREARTVWLADPTPMVEAHPELSFAAMNGGAPLARKTSWAGVQHRIELLQQHGIALPPPMAGGERVAADDVLDALAVAWTARRHLRGEATPLPDPPEADVSGIDAAIWV